MFIRLKFILNQFIKKIRIYTRVSNYIDWILENLAEKKDPETTAKTPIIQSIIESITPQTTTQSEVSNETPISNLPEAITQPDLTKLLQETIINLNFIVNKIKSVMEKIFA